MLTKILRITADTDDQIDIKISGADDFRFTANTFTALARKWYRSHQMTALHYREVQLVSATLQLLVVTHIAGDNITIYGQIRPW